MWAVAQYQSFEQAPAGLEKHRSDGPKAILALTFNRDQSGVAD